MTNNRAGSGGKTPSPFDTLVFPLPSLGWGIRKIKNLLTFVTNIT